MDTFELHENFITPAEQTGLIQWCESKKLLCIDRQNLHGGGSGRRFSQTVSRFRPLPSIVGELGHRMESVLRLKDATRLKYKLVIHEVGANTADHVDAYSNEYPNFFRAAILVKAAMQGGIFRVNQIPITFPELSLLSFIGSSVHGVTEVNQGERILLRANWYRP